MAPCCSFGKATAIAVDPYQSIPVAGFLIAYRSKDAAAVIVKI
jgi:hypothetical protein